MDKVHVAMISYISASSPENELKKIREKYKSLFVQSINPSFLNRHIELVVLQTLYAQKTNQSLARDSGVDFLMRITSDDQISSAISKGGARPNKKALLILAGKKNKVREAITSLLKELNEAKLVKDRKINDEDCDISVGLAAIVGIDRFKDRFKHPEIVSRQTS